MAKGFPYLFFDVYCDVGSANLALLLLLLTEEKHWPGILTRGHRIPLLQAKTYDDYYCRGSTRSGTSISSAPNNHPWHGRGMRHRITTPFSSPRQGPVPPSLAMIAPIQCL